MTDVLAFGAGFLTALGSVATAAAVVLRRRLTRKTTATATIPFDFSVYRLDED